MRSEPGCPRWSSRARQRGQAIILVLLLVGVGVTALVYGVLGSASLDTRRESNTAAALARVKEALTGWSVQRTPTPPATSPGPNARPGELPCPDINPLDGFEDGSCAAGAVGRVPWKTLGIPEPKDDAGETLWYAIAGPFRIWNMTSTPINSDTMGNITVFLQSTATQLTNQAVAVIFAAGAPLGTQNRDPSTVALCPATGTTIARNLCATNYLDTTGGVNNATINGPFISAQRSDTFNDRLLVITTAHLMPLVEQRVARELRTLLQQYKTGSVCKCYPWADISNSISDLGLNRGRVPVLVALPEPWGVGAIPPVPAWFTNNNWRWVIYYTAGRNYLDLGGAGCSSCVDPTLSVFSVDGVAGKEVVILTPGPAGASPRSPVPGNNTTFWQYYLEDPQNNDHATDISGNDLYVTPSSTAYARDRIYTIP